MTVDKVFLSSLAGEERKYQSVDVAEHKGGYALNLGAGMLYTPASLIFETKSLSLMRSIAAEWDRLALKEKIDLTCMPLTRLLCTLIDRIKDKKVSIVKYLVSQVDNDLLCYRASLPASLVKRQSLIWDPVLNWLELEYRMVISVSEGIIPISQSLKIKLSIEKLIKEMDVQTLTAFQALVSLTGSIFLSLMFVSRKTDAVGLVEAFYLDENWQMEQWGGDINIEKEKSLYLENVNNIQRFIDLR